jgi:hypothetical protein
MKKNARCRKATLAIAALLVAGALYPMTALGANKLIVKDSGGQVDQFVVTDTGAIGSGTNLPATAIHTYGNTVLSTQIRSQSVHATASTPGTPVTNEGGGFVGYFNYPSNGMPINGDRLGYFLFGANDSTGAAKNQAGFSVYAAGDWSLTSAPTEFVFLTTPVGSTGSAGRAERLRISSNGNIVIGYPQTTPATLDFTTFQKLEVNGGVRLNTSTAQPSCDNAHDIRGTFWFVKGSGGADTLQVCASNGSTVAWRTITLP